MSPSQRDQQPDAERSLEGDAVVISGMSGLFPDAHSVNEFSQVLYSKTNPVNKDVRWLLKHPQASEYTGKIPDLDRFDAQFFMVHKHQGNAMDPMCRKTLEQSYQAIYDAGVNPKHLDGKKVGVYIASAFSDADSIGFYDKRSKTGYGITGTSKTMFANRISYWLNCKGPSMMLDGACSGAMIALDEAYKSIKNGTIEAAIVGGVNLCLALQTMVHFSRCYKISSDDKTKSFDQNADGCIKSEAISVLFLQKAKDSLRAYAEVIHVSNEFILSSRDENSQNFGFIRNPAITADFLRNFYSKAQVSPNDVEYIEACGLATPEADKTELQSIERVFCDDRIHPLFVGSVISNIGYTDAASGATALTKVLLGYHNGVMASNLHCATPRQDIPAIQDGRLCVLTDHQPFRRTYAAVNCLSYAGVNSHALLRGCSKPKDLNKYKTSMPRLVIVSARQEEHVKDIFNDLKLRSLDAEEIALILNIHSTNIPGHLGRGYIVLDTDKAQNTVCLSECVERYDKSRRPLWFVYSGMGSQWVGMGTQLMRIPIFAAAIERCHKVLKPLGIDIVHIITTQDKTIFNNVLHAFVGIAAIQIGITDIFTALGLRPDNIIGHSVGELGCAYADDCLTAEEMIISAAYRGKASNDVDLIRGAMAAIGLGYNELSKICPPSIDIACHNSSTSSTISGPEESIRDFVKELSAKGIFAKEVPSANIAYHSRYISKAGPYLLTLLKNVIIKPKTRSERWLSTSVPQEKWNESSAKHCSPEYLTNNLLNPVLFEETSRLIPRDAVLVEIAPHGLLQAILKRALPDSCKNIPLTLRGHADNTQFLLDAVGKLFMEGYNLQVQALYPKVEFPVSAGTPHLAHLVKWNHSEQWSIASQGKIKVNLSATCKMLFSIHEEEHCYLTGNIIQGKNLYPFAGALIAVWDTLAMTFGFPKKQISVQFSDVHFYTQPIIHDQKQINLLVSLHRGSGHFEVLERDSKVATGFIFMISKPNRVKTEELNQEYNISSKEIYGHLRSRGYLYNGSFRSIAAVNESVTNAQIVWNDNWVTFIDGLLQLNVLRCSYEGISQPSQIKKLVINVNEHRIALQAQKNSNKILVPAHVDDIYQITKCNGIYMRHLKLRNLPLLPQENFKLIIPNINDAGLSNAKMMDDAKFVLRISNVGELDSLHWEEVRADPEVGVQVVVKYAGINMLDVKRATGITQHEESDKYFGMDFSGISKSGSRVMGVVLNGAVSTVLTAQPHLLWPVPPTWTLEDAATVPLAYAQAFYYLCIRSEIQRGRKVLIHGGTGALGQAAISIALEHGCKVFTTVSDAAKKAFLLKLFPELNEDSIGNSRDATFGDMILNATNGKGCEIVISCVHDDLKNISLKCAAFSGITIDTVQVRNRDNFEYGMFNMTRQRAYIAADFYSIVESESSVILKTIQNLVAEGISRGYVRPLSRVTFPADEPARAFRLLAASRHRGRVLLRFEDCSKLTIPRIICSPRGIQLILWDGSSLGLQLADRLIARGAKKIRLCCLNAVPAQHLLKLRLWKLMGAEVEITSHHLTIDNENPVIQNTGSAEEFIEGIYMSISDLCYTQYDKVQKIIDNLVIISKKSQPLLKYFIVICIGSEVRQKINLTRLSDGFPATVLHLSNPNNHDEFSGTVTDESQWNRCALDVAEIALRSKNPVLYTQPLTGEKPSLHKILPASYAENHNENATLEEMGLDDYLPSIQVFLRNVCHYYVENNNVKLLTKRNIEEIEKNAYNHQFEELKGLRIFYSEKHVDELRATTDWITLKTLVYDPEMMAGAIDTSRAHLFVVPGLEGLHTRFSTLCKRLKLPAVVLQPGLDRPQETPQLLARRHAKILLEEFQLKTDFYLLGFEFGIITALELAAILEDHGLIGTVYCIGDGPDEMRAFLESELSSFESESSLQDGICLNIHSLMTQDISTSLEGVSVSCVLQNCSSWQERVDACVRSLLGRVPQTAQYIRSLLDTVYVRIDMARSATATPRALRSRIVLLRARCKPGVTRTECSLQRYSQQALHVKELAAPMSHAAADLRVPAVINQYLHQNLLQEFENTNICCAYKE